MKSFGLFAESLELLYLVSMFFYFREFMKVKHFGRVGGCAMRSLRKM